MILNKYFLKNSSSAKHQQISSTKHCKQTIHNQCGKLSTPWVSPLEYSQFGGGKIGNENETDKISTLIVIRSIGHESESESESATEWIRYHRIASPIS